MRNAGTETLKYRFCSEWTDLIFFSFSSPVRIWQYLAEIQLKKLKIWNLRVQKNLNTERITFKVVQMKFLAMHITNQKLSFDIFTVWNLQNIFMEHDLNIISWHKRKMDNFDTYSVLLAIATNIPVLLMTAFVLQGHIWSGHFSWKPQWIVHIGTFYEFC